jgi:hypothetical protein
MKNGSGRKRMTSEMAAFIAWFNDCAPDGKRPLPSLARAGIAHLKRSHENRRTAAYTLPSQYV